MAGVEKLLLKDSRLCENGIALFNVTSLHRAGHKRELIVRMCTHKLNVDEFACVVKCVSEYFDQNIALLLQLNKNIVIGTN